MADEKSIKLFGFEIKKAKSKEDDKKLSIVPARDDDGAGYITSAGMHYGQYLNIDGDDAKDNYQLIMRYRGVSMHPEVDAAVEDIVNEAITGTDEKKSLDLNLDNVKISNGIKNKIMEEFDNIYSMLNFAELGHDIFRRWYIDGRLFHHLVVDETRLKEGIQEIRPIDAAKIRKITQVKTKIDKETGAKLIDKVDEYFIYQEKYQHAPVSGAQVTGVKLTLDSVSYVTSGLLSEDRKKIVSYLHKALKPINQLRMMEDSLVIYRLARAPERRIFYIDVGNLPRGRAEQYMKDIMTKYRNKLVYDARTGEIRDDRKHMSMLEDFWLPRREGGKGTEISTLPGGENLGQIDDIIYFQKRLYRALNVPINRLEQEAQFSLGRSTEISRDELKFQKFVERLRKRFSHLFYGILKKQLILKGICTEEDWEDWKSDILIDYVEDNYFSELKDAEMLRERMQTLDMVQNYVGEFFSKEWVLKNVLRLSDEEAKEMRAQIEKESAEAPSEDEEENSPPSRPQQEQTIEMTDEDSQINRKTAQLLTQLIKT